MNHLDFHLDLIHHTATASFVAQAIVKDFLMLLFPSMLGLHSTATAIDNGGKAWCEDDKRNFAILGKHSSSCWIKPHKFKPWCSGKFVVLHFS